MCCLYFSLEEVLEFCLSGSLALANAVVFTSLASLVIPGHLENSKLNSLGLILEVKFPLDIGLSLVFTVKLIFDLNHTFIVKDGSMQLLVLVSILASRIPETALLAVLNAIAILLTSSLEKSKTSILEFLGLL